MSTKTSIRIAALTAAVAGGAVAGALLAAPAISNAQDAPATTEAPAPSTDPAAPSTDPAAPSTDPGQAPQGRHGKGPRGDFDPTKGGHVGQNGQKEELLTGDAATRATAAAQAAVPDGTIERVETDVEGDVYEAHVRKADGTEVTVKMDADFNVTKTEDGPQHP